MHETLSEIDTQDSPAERPVHVSRTVVSSLRRALNAARNRRNTAAKQAEQIEKMLEDLIGRENG